MITKKIYDFDSHLSSFDAVIIAKEPTESGCAVILDQTAFFPEGGGQPGDTGKINGFTVVDTKTVNGEILHFIDVLPDLAVGDRVNCELNYKERFARMQAHSGEHIVSGLAYALFGAENVGFHMDGFLMTVDFSLPLSKPQLQQLEQQANEIVWQNKTVRVFYPSPEEAAVLSFRSKLDNITPLRLVEIEDCDLCACCAPHVGKTGEIGLIKILTSCSHRGGVRITLVCGQAAYSDYCKKYKNSLQIAALLKTPHNDIFEGVLAQEKKIDRLKDELRDERRTRIAEIISSLSFQQGNIVYCARQFDMSSLLRLADEGKALCDGVFVALSGDDCKGYTFAAASISVDLGENAKRITSALNGRGGGSGAAIQGTFGASKAQISEFFANF